MIVYVVQDAPLINNEDGAIICVAANLELAKKEVENTTASSTEVPHWVQDEGNCDYHRFCNKWTFMVGMLPICEIHRLKVLV